MWCAVLAIGSGIFDPALFVSGTYVYTVSSQICATDSTSNVDVNVIPEPDAGDNATVDLCVTDSTIDLFSILGGDPDAGGTWSPELNSGTGIFDPSIDSAGSYNYVVPAIAPCNGNANSVVTVNIFDTPASGFPVKVKNKSIGESVSQISMEASLPAFASRIIITSIIEEADKLHVVLETVYV